MRHAATKISKNGLVIEWWFFVFFAKLSSGKRDGCCAHVLV
jgi:hypothetical protein